MPDGIVTHYNARRGFGFLETPAQSEDVFFHVSDIHGPEPVEGERFTFDVAQEMRGPRAQNLERA